MAERPELQADEPLALLKEWLSKAEATELNDPTAAALATATPAGDPSVRMVLLKGFDDRGIRFFTNAGSQKGHELAENPRAALCLHWKSLRRQIRVEGTISELSAAETDEYFHSRSRRSQIGAAVSHQSQPLPDRSLLEQQVADFAARHAEGEIPRPDSWKGYLLRPHRVEFWIDGADRLHDRLLFTRDGDSWAKSRLYP